MWATIIVGVLVLMFIYMYAGNLGDRLKKIENSFGSLDKQNKKLIDETNTFKIKQEELTKQQEILTEYLRSEDFLDRFGNLFLLYFNPFENNFIKTLNLNKNTLVIGQEEAIKSVIKASFPGIYATLTKLAYWKVRLENISGNFEEELISRLRNICKSEEYFIVNNKAVIVTPWDQLEYKQSLERIKGDILLLEKDNGKNFSKVNWLSTRSASFYDQVFVQIKELSDEENAFLSKRADSFKQIIKSVENSGITLLKSWELIEEGYDLFNKEILPYINQLHLTENEKDSGELSIKIDKFKTIVKKIEKDLTSIFYKSRIIKAYNLLYVSNQNFNDTTSQNKVQIKEWRKIYVNALSVFEEFMKKNLDIVKIDVEIGQKFSGEIHDCNEPAVYREDKENDTIVNIRSEGFKFQSNGKIIVKSEVQISKR